jgi:hypothetical protein
MSVLVFISCVLAVTGHIGHHHHVSGPRTSTDSLEAQERLMLGLVEMTDGAGVVIEVR